jgi:hypothetical protein
MYVPSLKFSDINPHDYDLSLDYEEHFLTRSFREAHLIKDFDYDLSLLDKKDFTKFIQISFEPEFLDLALKLQVRDLYMHKDLFHVFELFTKFVPCTENIASDYYCQGHISYLRIQVCEKPLFDNNGILLSSPGNTYKTYYKTYIRGLKRI